jgi:peptidoglycan lytic transglycosylase
MLTHALRQMATPLSCTIVLVVCTLACACTTGRAAAPRAAPTPRVTVLRKPSTVVSKGAGRYRALAVAHGQATYYADFFDGRRTASGIVFRNSRMYAAHREYPFGTLLRVTNLNNNRTVIVEVVDRGPHGTSARARRTIIDVSKRAARELDFIPAGRIDVQLEVLEWGRRGQRE